MNIDGYIAPVVTIALLGEIIVAFATRQNLYTVRDTISNIGVGFLQRSMHVVVDVIFMGAYAFIYKQLAPFHIAADSVVGFLVLFILLDINAYWYHRFSHRVNFAWAAHSVHHQSEEMNLTVGFRISLTSVPIHWMFLLPFALLGFEPVLFFLTYTIVTAYEVWYHTRTIGRLGWLEYFLVTPSNHRVHHGYNSRYIDKNYGAMFCVWDRLFGTFVEETEAPVFGTATGLQSHNPLRALADPFLDIHCKGKALPRISDRLLIWFRAPDWWLPNLPRVAHEVGPRRSPDRTPLRPQLGVYLLCNCFLMIPTLVVFAHLAQDAPILARIALALFAGLNFGILSWLASEFKGARIAEVIRIMCWAGALVTVAERLALPDSVIAGIIILAAGLALWLAALVGVAARHGIESRTGSFGS